ncbi:MAG: crossover junction endodeoxyribonuclease RuvC [Patescibacteria group bacterium]|nr:crossover junction endodeoxyribonuclease RuvC [Patescibacteria group bacterium]
MKNKQNNIILGIDPGLATTGYAFIKESDSKILDYGIISTSSKQEFSLRLEYIFNALNDLIKKYHPSSMAVEQLFFCKNVKTALLVGQARGVILLTARLNKLPLYEFTPLQVKQAVCGYGKADKRQVQEMVKALLKLNKIPKPDDAADALAIALTCQNSKKFFDRIR